MASPNEGWPIGAHTSRPWKALFFLVGLAEWAVRLAVGLLVLYVIFRIAMALLGVVFGMPSLGGGP